MTNNGKETLKMASPWMIFAREVAALFEKDPEVRVEFDNDRVELRIYVENAIKANALEKVLPTYRDFGNVRMNIDVIPENSKSQELSMADLLRLAFNGNAAFDGMISVPESMGFGAYYMMFVREVVQIEADNLSDPYGNLSMLYQDIAKDVFDGNHDGVFFSTSPDYEDAEG